MRLRVLAVGTRMPDWVDAGCQDYSRRLRGHWKIEWIELANASRRESGGAAANSRQAEGKRILAALGARDYVTALDERGTLRTSIETARWLEERRASGRDLALIIGGADGLSDEVLARADARWSLSRLTLPHALVRVVLAEQLYRGATLLAGHPYHRE